MSLIKNLEIDTLKLRNLQVKDSYNNPISSGFHLYANGDGTTYWSSGVDAQEFINLSTSIDETNSTLANLESSIGATLSSYCSTTTAEVISSFNSVSTFYGSIVTFEQAQAYIDATMPLYFSTYNGSTIQPTYQTIISSIALYNSNNQSIASTYSSLTIQIGIVSSHLTSTNLLVISSYSSLTVQIGVVSSHLTSTNLYTISTFSSVYAIESTNFNVLNTLIVGNILYTSTTFSQLNSSQISIFSTLSTIPIVLTSTFNANSSLTATSVSTSYASSIAFTSLTVSSLRMDIYSSSIISQSTIQGEISSVVSTLNSARISTVSTILSTVYAVSTSLYSTISSFQNNITLLLSTGLTQNIYQTFIDLQAYSEDIIASTISTSNYAINSTNTALEAQSVSSYNAVMDSSFLYLTENVYQSTLSTVIPSMNSTIDAEISASVVLFNQIIVSTTNYFTLLVNVTYVTFTEDIAAETLAYESTISSYIESGLSTQIGIQNSSLIYNTGLLDSTVSTYIYSLSSFTYTQYITNPSIIANSVLRISTLSNTGPVTGLSTLKTGLINLDLSYSNNFYVLISDIGNDVYYGFNIISTSKEKINQDFTIQIDIQSTYTNKYVIIDTTNLSYWLTTPKIYNPYSYNIITNNYIPGIIPIPNTVQQLYISSFIGAYIVDMRYTPMGLFIRSIQSYPFIYSNVIFTGTIVIPQNVQVSNTALAQHSSFVYRGTPITMTWQTNDLNIPLGVKFTGTDLYGNQITSWSGPYPSALGTAQVRAPVPTAPFAKYDMMYLGVYPNTPRADNSVNGNSTTPIFNSRIIPSSLYVVNPTINSYVRVLNPGTVNTFIQVAEINVQNDIKQNLVHYSTYARFTTDTTADNINTIPFNGSYTTYGPQNAFDNNISTFFYGGVTTSQINPNAYVGCKFSSYSSFVSAINQSSLLISSIEVYAGPQWSIDSMNLVLSNRNEPGIADGLFYSTIILISSTSQSYGFS